MGGSPVTIHEVDTAKRADVRRFIMFPFDLYKNHEFWVPAVMQDARLQLDRKKGAFFRNNDAAFFLALRDGRVVGRIAAIDPRYFNDFKGTRETHFFLFDSVNDQAVANALFDAAADWGRARGHDVFRGPLGFLPLDGIGMLAEGFDILPAVGIPYNYAYYNDLVAGWGFEIEERIYSGQIDVPAMIASFPEKVLRVAQKVRERYNIEAVSYKTKKALKDNVVQPVVKVYNEALTHIAGDPPIHQAEVQQVVDSLLMIVDPPEMIKFLKKDGEIIGFVLGYKNVNRGIQKAKGRVMTPWGLFHFLRDLKTTTHIDFNGSGIVPEFQGLGGTALMYEQMYQTLKQFPKMKTAEAIQLSEFNAKSLNEMKSFVTGWGKTHIIYRKAL